MAIWRRWSVALRSLFGADRAARELDEELRYHLERDAERHAANGLPPAAARAAARRGFGNVTAARDAARDAAGWPWLERVIEDARYAARALRKRPTFSLVAIATLALGFAANTAVFGVVRGVLLRGLDYPEAERIVRLWSIRPARGAGYGGVSRQDADDWIAGLRSFEAIGTFSATESNVLVGADPQRVTVALATANMFRAVGTPPWLGRALDAADDASAPGTVAVLSYEFWQRSLGGDSAVIGRRLTIGGQPRTIVGVMPPRYAFPDPAVAAWLPFGAPPDRTGPRIARWVSAVARLRPGVTVAVAQGEIDAMSARLASDHPASNEGVGAVVEPLLTSVTGTVRPLLLMAWGAAALVMLAIVTNLANLFLTRAAAREGEVAVCTALGASRGALARRFLIESLLVTGLGGGLGVLAAFLALPALRRLADIGIPRADLLAIDAPVVWIALAAVLLVGIVLGLIPSLVVARAAPSTLLRSGKGAAALSRGGVRSTLIVAQVALATLVLVGAGLLYRSFDRLTGVQPGFEVARHVAFRVAPNRDDYPQRERARGMYADLATRLAALPGVTAVSAINRMPLTGSWWTTMYRADDRVAAPGQEPSASYRVVMPGYFEAIGVPLVRGRSITAADDAAGARVVVVSRSLAERAWAGVDPIGHRLVFDTQHADAPVYTVVGVVGDVPSSGMADPRDPLVYIPFPQANFGHFGDWGMDVVIAGAGDPASLLAAAREVARGVAPTTPVYEARPLEALVSRDLARRRFLLLLMGSLAATAVLLAALGLFGVVAYGVTQRRAEFGVRMALGASASSVRALVLRQAIWLAVGGVAFGVIGAAFASRWLASLLYGVAPLDPPTFAAAALSLLATSSLAAWLPAFRASRVDPIEALRAP